ncbi:HpcH/HpaI aldolase/citrate lyase family protein [Burkholderia oklahomensis]|uniref:HpcH/HpaI aldolase/citrate lyase family protein n=1 Tax=Burkholderia oklahomensis TaxID=342113 RepID=A0AAI8B8F0_9BURK|nr:CoA ester lyase [Burkholderia oklahomensis]AIO67495.1 hpcH/HpaI aldolase/citrate lyase family protein [Burkholderia oklahomensis]AOI44217.1 aldolase [Burkholderia oklahomensis EO147]KUY54549.1 aldolase [Burkholderia oklahomensis EO147]QPS37526.1 CoA ester lyase [Burkholderia oklahomensis]
MPNNAAIPPQSYLFVPGSRPDRFERALSSGADAVIVDLEDAVEPAAKDAAREAVAAWVSRSRPVLVRINGRDTRWFDQDAKLAALGGVAGIVIPKAECPDDVVAVVARARRKVPIFPLIETARGMWSAMDIAKAPCVKRLMFGTLDFIAEMGMDDDRDPLNPHRAQLALVSRVAGLDAPVDGVTPDVHDVDRLRAGTLNGKKYGFGAKLCIHPAQVAAVHACYSPSERELDWAARVVDAASRAEAGAITVDGKMVDRPVVLRAQRLLACAAYRRTGASE